MVGSHSLKFAFSAASVFLMAATISCKEVKPTPKKDTSVPKTDTFTSTNINATPPSPTPLPVDPRCAQTDSFICNVAEDLVELCKTKEPDATVCTQIVWTKELFDKMVAEQSGTSTDLEPCKSDHLFVATDNDPLALRENPDVAANAIEWVERRQSVKCIGMTGFWAKVKTEGEKEGFMKAEFLSVTRPDPAVSSGSSGNSGASGTTGSPQGTTAPAPRENTIECSKWVFQESKTESTFAGSTCDDKNGDTWSLLGAKNKWLNCVKVGAILGVWQCKCDRFQEEKKWLTIAECKSPWAPIN